MADVASWASCVGAWLLFGGALHQGALDLRAEQELGDRIEEAKRASADALEPVSAWWLLLPPVYLAKRHRRSEERRMSIVLDLDDDEHERLMRYLNQAFGWMVVGLGAVLLAIATTVDLGDERGWPGAVTAAVVVGAATVALVTIASQTRRTERGHELWRRARDQQAATDAAED